MMIHKFGQLLGAGTVLLSAFEFACISAAAFVRPVYLVAPPITVQQVDAWQPVINTVVLGAVGLFSMAYPRIVAARLEGRKLADEKLRQSVDNTLARMDERINAALQQIQEASIRRDSLRSELKAGLDAIHDQISDIAIEVDRHAKVIAAAERKALERAKILKISQQEPPK